MEPLARSYLYVPADRAEMVGKALDRGADALVLDLEDAVTAVRKDQARQTLAEFLRKAEPASPPSAATTTGQLWVRINAHHIDADLAVLSPQVAGVWVPKAEPDLLGAVDLALTGVERRLGLGDDTFRVVALIETARGVLDCGQIAAAPRVRRLGIGEADLAGELGLQPGPERAEFASIRSQIVVASAAAGIAPPVGPAQTALRDQELLERSTRALLRQGFRARSAVHPGQLDTINRVFTPTPAEVESAEAVLDAMQRAEEEGSGVTTDGNGQMLDRAVVRSAFDVLGRARMGSCGQEAGRRTGQCIARGS